MTRAAKRELVLLEADLDMKSAEAGKIDALEEKKLDGQIEPHSSPQGDVDLVRPPAPRSGEEPASAPKALNGGVVHAFEDSMSTSIPFYSKIGGGGEVACLFIGFGAACAFQYGWEIVGWLVMGLALCALGMFNWMWRSVHDSVLRRAMRTYYFGRMTLDDIRAVLQSKMREPFFRWSTTSWLWLMPFRLLVWLSGGGYCITGAVVDEGVCLMDIVTADVRPANVRTAKCVSDRVQINAGRLCYPDGTAVSVVYCPEMVTQMRQRGELLDERSARETMHSWGSRISNLMLPSDLSAEVVSSSASVAQVLINQKKMELIRRDEWVSLEQKNFQGVVSSVCMDLVIVLAMTSPFLAKYHIMRVLDCCQISMMMWLEKLCRSPLVLSLWDWLAQFLTPVTQELF